MYTRALLGLGIVNKETPATEKPGRGNVFKHSSLYQWTNPFIDNRNESFIIKYSNMIQHKNDICKKLGEEGFDLTVGYCPMVNMWSQLTDDEDRIWLLCDTACSMYGKIVDKKGMHFEKAEAIAQGCGTCRLRFGRE